MKIYWPLLLLLLTLVSCGKEEFGTSSQTHQQPPDPILSYNQLSCSSHTIIKPKVDVLYVVDNSTSTYHLASDIKTAIMGTVNTISTRFDYRVIGTGLLPTPGDATPFNDYQVFTNSQDPLSGEASSRIVISASQLNFFSSPVSGSEAGLRRTIEFINHNRANGSGLFRQGAYLMIVLISNGRDTEVEFDKGWGNGETGVNTTIFDARKSAFYGIKADLALQQLRFFSVTAVSNCYGSLSSLASYVSMSTEFGAQNFDICQPNGASSLFTSVNNSIDQVIVPHKYKYWPITSTNGEINTSSIKVFKSGPNSAPVELTSGWQYTANPNYPGNINTRIFPLPQAEPTSARHLIEFSSGNEVVYPDCISVRTNSKTEYFGYVVLAREPRPASIDVKINNQSVPNSSTNGWTYVGYMTGVNIKMPYPSSGDELPAVNRTGFMIRLNGSSKYYKSGDSVVVDFLPAEI